VPLAILISFNHGVLSLVTFSGEILKPCFGSEYSSRAKRFSSLAVGLGCQSFKTGRKGTYKVILANWRVGNYETFMTFIVIEGFVIAGIT